MRRALVMLVLFCVLLGAGPAAARADVVVTREAGKLVLTSNAVERRRQRDGHADRDEPDDDPGDVAAGCRGRLQRRDGLPDRCQRLGGRAAGRRARHDRRRDARANRRGRARRRRRHRHDRRGRRRDHGRRDRQQGLGGRGRRRHHRPRRAAWRGRRRLARRRRDPGGRAGQRPAEGVRGDGVGWPRSRLGRVRLDRAGADLARRRGQRRRRAVRRRTCWPTSRSCSAGRRTTCCAARTGRSPSTAPAATTCWPAVPARTSSRAATTPTRSPAARGRINCAGTRAPTSSSAATARPTSPLCGAGADAVTADIIDTLMADCERVDLPPPPPVDEGVIIPIALASALPPPAVAAGSQRAGRPALARTADRPCAARAPRHRDERDVLGGVLADARAARRRPDGAAPARPADARAGHGADDRGRAGPRHGQAEARPSAAASSARRAAPRARRS